MAKQKTTTTATNLRAFEIIQDDRRHVYAALTADSAIKQHQVLFKSTEPKKPAPARIRARQLTKDAKLTIELDGRTITQDAAKFVDGSDREGYIGEALN
jgi:hypothetical protein